MLGKAKTNSKPLNAFLFWQRWLFYSSLFFVLFGIVLALYGNNPLFKPYMQALAHIFGQQQNIPEEVAPFVLFVSGPLGATIACSYILLAYLSWYPFQKKERWARNAILVAFGTWVFIDSVVCIYYRAYFQVYLINGFSILQKALPLIFTWNDFKKLKANASIKTNERN